MRLHLGLGAGLTLALTLVVPGACNGSNGSGGDGGTASDGTTGGDDASEPLICLEFAEAGVGEPCSAPSPVRCFAECEAGGCSCVATANGPRWVCETDLSCSPDCGPLDDGCSPPTGDDGGDDGTGDDSGGEAGLGDGAVDGGDGGDGGDGSGDAGTSDASDASG